MRKIVFLQLATSTSHVYPTLRVIRDLARCHEVTVFASKNQYSMLQTIPGIKLHEYQLINKQNISIDLRRIPPVYSSFMREIIERIIINNCHYDNIIKTVMDIAPDYLFFDEWVSILGEKIARILHIPGICSITKFAFAETLFDSYALSMQRCMGFETLNTSFGKARHELDNLIAAESKKYGVCSEMARYFLSGHGHTNIVYTSSHLQPEAEHLKSHPSLLAHRFLLLPMILVKKQFIYLLAPITTIIFCSTIL